MMQHEVAMAWCFHSGGNQVSVLVLLVLFITATSGVANFVYVCYLNSTDII